MKPEDGVLHPGFSPRIVGLGIFKKGTVVETTGCDSVRGVGRLGTVGETLAMTHISGAGLRKLGRWAVGLAALAMPAPVAFAHGGGHSGGGHHGGGGHRAAGGHHGGAHHTTPHKSGGAHHTPVAHHAAAGHHAQAGPNHNGNHGHDGNITNNHFGGHNGYGGFGHGGYGHGGYGGWGGGLGWGGGFGGTYYHRAYLGSATEYGYGVGPFQPGYGPTTSSTYLGTSTTPLVTPPLDLSASPPLADPTTTDPTPFLESAGAHALGTQSPGDNGEPKPTSETTPTGSGASDIP